MRNYEDSKCAWGYITLCDKCVAIITERKNSGLGRSYSHINTEKEVKGFPLAEECEACHEGR